MNPLFVAIALVAVTASIAYAAPDMQKILEQALTQQSPDDGRFANRQDDGDDADMQRFYSFLKDAMSRTQEEDGPANEQDDRDSRDMTVQDHLQNLKSLLATAQDDGDDARMEAEVEKLFAKEQVPAAAQASYHALYNRAKHFAMYSYHRFRNMYTYIARYMPYLKRRYYYSVYGRRYCKNVRRCYHG